jgi:hypothetical protein
MGRGANRGDEQMNKPFPKIFHASLSLKKSSTHVVIDSRQGMKYLKHSIPNSKVTVEPKFSLNNIFASLIL